MPESRYRAWTITLNNYTKVDETYFWGEEITRDIRYLIVGKEIAPTTGTPHLQGYIYFKNAKTISAVKKYLRTNEIHLAASKGTSEHNEIYCKKDGEFREYGEKPQQGKRNDLVNLKDEILEGKKVEDIILENPMAYHQYGRTLEKIEEIAQRKKFRHGEMTTCDWYVAETGMGKSHKAFKDYDPDKYYNLNTDDRGWWDGYKQQETVIINDFRGEIRYAQMLQLIDKWPYSVPRRNKAPMPFTSKKIIITSVLKPEECYHNIFGKDSIAQLKRRVNVIEMTEGEP